MRRAARCCAISDTPVVFLYFRAYMLIHAFLFFIAATCLFIDAELACCHIRVTLMLPMMMFAVISITPRCCRERADACYAIRRRCYA